MKRRALFIGVDRYREPLLPLTCAVSDAARMCGLFENVLGFETRLLSDPSSEDVKMALRELTSDMFTGDVFMFYFAGHGFTPIGGGRQTLVCATDDYDDVCQNWAGVPFDYVEDKTSKGGYGRVFIIDACRSALLPSRSVGADTRDLIPASEYVKCHSGPAPYFLMQSCRRGQSAIEVKSKRRGLFSLALQELIRESVSQRKAFTFSHSLTLDLQMRMQKIAAAEGFRAEQIPDPAGDSIAIPCSGETSYFVERVDTSVSNRVETASIEAYSMTTERVIESWLMEANRLYKDKQYSKAAVLYERCATRGSAVATNKLGDMYLFGWGFSRDASKAAKWYRMAAEKGSYDAQMALGNLYLAGDGVPQDEAEARKWYQKAVESLV